MRATPVVSLFAFALIAAGCDDSTPTSPTAQPVLTNYVNTPRDISREPGDLVRPAVDLEGLYTVTFTAASVCSQLPPAVRTRSYSAAMRPTSNVHYPFTAELAGADFFPAYDTFWWGAGNDFGRFQVFSWHAYNWGLANQPIVERVGSTGFVAFMGTANAPLPPSPTAINAQFDGSINFCYNLTPPAIPNSPPTCAAQASVSCRSDQHQVRFVRR
jgi:hypothetical protein